MSSIQSQHERIAYGYKMTVAMIAMTTLPTSAVLIVFAPEIIQILLGSQWTAAIIPFQILSATLVCRTGYKAIGTLARAKGAIYQTAWRQFLYAGMVICGALLGQNYGVNGVAAGVGGAIAIQFLVMHSFGLRISGIKAMELVTIHARHLAATLVLTSTIVSCKLVMASFGWGDIPVLMTGLAAAGAVYLLMLIGLPRIFGEEGIWAKKILSQYGERALQFAKRA
jgi:PST family polysaccharide transporter